MTYGFAELHLEVNELRVLDFNERATRCYASCGFHEIERIPSDVVDGERDADDIIMMVTPRTFVGA